jgi:ribonuclease R
VARKQKQDKSSRRKAKSKPARLPTREELLEYIQSAPDRIGRREIARAFGIKGGDRVELKRLLREMADDGLINNPRKRISKAGELPRVCVIEITGRDEDGEFIAEPASWDVDESGARPRILLLPEKQAGVSAPGVGDRILARIEQIDTEPGYQARTIKRLGRERSRLIGIFRTIAGGGGLIEPVDRKQLKEWSVRAGDTADANNGELVRFELLRGGRYGVPKVRVLERLGDPDGQGATSLIAIHEHGLRDEFPDPVSEEAANLPAVTIKSREDLRDLPLVTIDPADARDHDDAVWAAPDDNPDNEGGWVVIVAIADVAWFVRPGSGLDREALLRGNSVYFPDRVVPMLPDTLSGAACSLHAGEDRACLAVRMRFRADGTKISQKFTRAMMRSAASLSYNQAQKAIDGSPDDETGPLLDTVLHPLWQAYAALARARDQRGPLDLDLPERKVLLNDAGQIENIVTPPRLEAHRLIEEFMIQANVAAAETLEERRSPLIYRIHDAPSIEKLQALGEFLASLDMKLPKAGRLSPADFNKILSQTRKSDLSELVSEVVLRSQSQAEYSPANLGHFGLNLRRYAHFTSPIRRYADLVVHRALIRALDLGDGGLSDGEIPKLEDISQSISRLERQAIAAERQTIDRLIAAFLADRIGAIFTARISGVTRSGLFVKLDDTGADGFVPAATILGDFYRLDESVQALVGDRGGLGFQLGDNVDVRLVEAIPSAGALRFEMMSDGRKIATGKRGKMSGKRKSSPRSRKRGRRGR